MCRKHLEARGEVRDDLGGGRREVCRLARVRPDVKEARARGAGERRECRIGGSRVREDGSRVARAVLRADEELLPRALPSRARSRVGSEREEDGRGDRELRPLLRGVAADDVGPEIPAETRGGDEGGKGWGEDKGTQRMLASARRFCFGVESLPAPRSTPFGVPLSPSAPPAAAHRLSMGGRPPAAASGSARHVASSRPASAQYVAY
jgi:hypothetical protein